MGDFSRITGSFIVATAMAACGGGSGMSPPATDAGDADGAVQDAGLAMGDGTPGATGDTGPAVDATAVDGAGSTADATVVTDAGSAADVSSATDGTAEASANGGTCLAAIDAGAMCNELEPQGPTIVSTCSSASPPQPMGGTIIDGTYLLVSMTDYAPCPVDHESDRFTWLVSGNTWTTVQENPKVYANPDAGVMVVHITAAVVGSGPTLTVTPMCSTPYSTTATTTWDYDVTSTGLVLYIRSATGIMRADTYLRQ